VPADPRRLIVTGYSAGDLEWGYLAFRHSELIGNVLRRLFNSQSASKNASKRSPERNRRNGVPIGWVFNASASRVESREARHACS
jgi:hypothetical protein